MIIALGSDHAGFALKKSLLEHLRGKGTDCRDYGAEGSGSVDYPDYAAAVARAVLNGTCHYGILICGTGIGMSVAANKHQGIRAALCSEPFSARCAREHNNANILALGSRVIGPGLALEIVDVFLATAYTGGRHDRRLDKITLMEKGFYDH